MRIRVMVPVVFAMLIAPLAARAANAVEYGLITAFRCVEARGEVPGGTVQGALCLDESGTRLTLVATLRDAEGQIRRGLVARGTVQRPATKLAPRPFQIDDVSVSLIDVEGSCPGALERSAPVHGVTLQQVAEAFGDRAIRLAQQPDQCTDGFGQP